MIQRPKSPFKTLSNFESRDVKWMWEPFIPLGLISILEGDPNVGKSYLAMHIAAQVSTGGCLPGLERMKCGRVLYLSTEDEPEYTIRPRIEAMGGDVSRIRILTNKYFPLDERGIKLLRKELEDKPARLIVFDTLFSFVPSTSDTNKPNDMREILGRFAQIASEFKTAVLIIRHWTKGDRGKAIYRGSGSIDIIGLARAGIAVAIAPDDPNLRVMAHVKHNLSLRSTSFLYEIARQPSARLPTIKWRGKSPLTADDIQGTTTQPSAIEVAENFIKEQLADGPKLARKVGLAAQKRLISSRTLDRAKETLDVESKKTKDGWIWSLPRRRAPAA